MKNPTENPVKSTTNADGNYELSETPARKSILPESVAFSPARLLAALLPNSCLLCGTAAGSELLCPPCRADLPALPAHACPCCGERTTHGERCGACLVQPPHFIGVSALYRYAFPADRLIQALKYQHRLALAGWFGQSLAQACAKVDAQRIVPLPLHPVRLRERGFNQAMEIARALGNCLKIPVDRHILQRPRATSPQAGLPLKERRSNVRGAFECSGDLGGARILLVDDVLTSGATADECARVLRLHGAGEVHVAVVARALKD